MFKTTDKINDTVFDADCAVLLESNEQLKKKLNELERITLENKTLMGRKRSNSVAADVSFEPALPNHSRLTLK